MVFLGIFVLLLGCVNKPESAKYGDKSTISYAGWNVYLEQSTIEDPILPPGKK